MAWLGLGGGGFKSDKNRNRLFLEGDYRIWLTD